MLRLGLLGPPTVELDEAPAVFDTRKAVALLALLAVERREQSRDQLAVALWPDSDDARSRASLRRTLSVTSASVGAALRISRSTVVLDQHECWCDLWEYARLAAASDAASLSAAAELYRGDFLAGFHARAGAEFDHWQEVVAEEQRQRLGAVLDKLVLAESTAGDLEAALAHARRRLSLDELHEPAHRSLMQILAWSGQRSAALEQYRRCVRVLDEELGVAPLGETTSLYEAIRANRLAELDHLGDAGTDEAAGVVHGTRPVAAAVKLPSQERLLDDLAGELHLVESSGRIAVLAGPSGSGKSWLLDALRRREGSGAVWITARCHEGERTLELGCAAELLRSAFATRPTLGQKITDTVAQEVARLAPELVARHGPAPPPLGSPGAQVRFFRAVGSTLATAVAGRARGVIVVEDAGHLDETSALLLGYLVRRVSEIPALILFTLEDGAAPAALVGALDDAGRRDGVVRLAAPRLDRDDVIAMLSSRGVVADPDAFLAETGGLALLVAAYADALATPDPDEAAGRPSDRAHAVLPTSARQLFADRVARAGGVTGQVVHAAAVLGSAFDAHLLRAASGRSSAEVADALDVALARGLLVERSVSGRGDQTYEFPYEGLRQVAYDSVGSARRRLLHGRAADALAGRAESTASGSLYSVVAAHLSEAGRRDEAAAWAWRSAQRSLSLFAHAEALDHLRQAVELGYPAQEVLPLIADVLVVLGRYREASSELEKAAASLAPDDAGVAAVIEHRLASVHERLGNWPVAAAHVDAALELAGADPALRARIEADRALVSYRCGDAAAGELAVQALADAKAVGDPEALAQAYNVAGMIAARAGDSAQGEEWLRASLAVARDLSDPSASVAALNNLSKFLHDAGRTDEALEVAREALRRGVEHGDVHRAAALHSNLADLLHALGRTSESIDHLKEAATGFASVDPGDEVSPGVWTLTQW